MSASEIAMAAESRAESAPAVVAYHADVTQRLAPLVADLLARLDRIARELYPAWLPAATQITSPAGAGVVAVRSIALREARETGQFGPFLADLAERSLLPGRTRPDTRFGRETRARGLARVIAASYDRTATVILVNLVADLTEVQEDTLTAAARWLTDSGFGVWFIGIPLRTADTVERVSVVMPRTEPADDGPAEAGAIIYPAVPGRPHPASEAERALEASLGMVEWSAGRAWNQHHQVHPLANPVRLDLFWRAERLVVEIDGDEHRAPVRFAADRQRDVLLQLAGYAVLRFTNSQVLEHRDLVLTQIREFLAGRRAEEPSGSAA
ncbi:endonuclease domain-containing protein [Actinoplanes subglobosus]|uniref:Endonuclease domain-containing protein n=1 Tax=Actinoplanes subglobosus TaxID=1547892 RepID=A0ABV8J7M1_9ACTN